MASVELTLVDVVAVVYASLAGSDWCGEVPAQAFAVAATLLVLQGARIFLCCQSRFSMLQVKTSATPLGLPLCGSPA